MIDEKVVSQLEIIRDSGLTNMFDFNAVQVIAFRNRFYELVTWVNNPAHAVQ